MYTYFTTIFYAIFLATSVSCYPTFIDDLVFLEKRQVENGVEVFVTSENNTNCEHGTRRCSNGMSGYNSSDICNWNKWMRYKCPNGLMCVENDWVCAHPWQNEWISNVYHQNPKAKEGCSFGLSEHGCAPRQPCIVAYNSTASVVAAVTLATQITYSYHPMTVTDIVTSTTTNTVTSTSTAACATQTIVVQQPCVHGSKKCTEKGAYTCVYGIWQGCLCDKGSYCIPHFYECLPFESFVNAVISIKNEISSTVYEGNAPVPYYAVFDAGPTIINVNDINIDIDIVITAPVIVSTSTQTETETDTKTSTWSTTYTQNWTETTTYETTSVITSTLTVIPTTLTSSTITPTTLSNSTITSTTLTSSTMTPTSSSNSTMTPTSSSNSTMTPTSSSNSMTLTSSSNSTMTPTSSSNSMTLTSSITTSTSSIETSSTPSSSLTFSSTPSSSLTFSSSTLTSSSSSTDSMTLSSSTSSMGTSISQNSTTTVVPTGTIIETTSVKITTTTISTIV